MTERQREMRIGGTQYAVQLVGPDRLVLNREKPVEAPGPHEMLLKVEAVGLCFSDLKVLKQFSAHPRKSEVVSGLAKEVLDEIPSYVPGDRPTVPGHEAVCRIVAAGDAVARHRVGERVLVQADYRPLRTASSNAAFGYNFEGALQEYVIVDERVMIDRETDESYLIPVDDSQSASAVALVEPWACVEDSYVSPERRAPLAGGRMLVVADAGHRVEGLEKAMRAHGLPASVAAVCAETSQADALRRLNTPVTEIAQIEGLANESFDDIIYFGAKRATVEALSDKLAAHGLINTVLGGARIGAPVSVGVGRVHYGGTRWTGTLGTSAADAYAAIPETGELRPGDRMLVVGAAGPMGTMHVIRALSSGVPGLSVVGTDFDDARLEALRRKAEPVARARGVAFELVNTSKAPLAVRPSYAALMAPVGSLVAEAVDASAPGCIINIFAGIPAQTKEPIDLDRYIENRCWMFGTSGSVIRDMRLVLEKVVAGTLDTNASVDAVSGMAGAVDGIRAVENRSLAGKIIVYPALRELGLVPLSGMAGRFATVAALLEDGKWTGAAEDELLRVAR